MLLRRAKLLWLLGAIASISVIVVGQYQRAATQSQNLRSEFDRIETMSGSRQVVEESNYKPGSAYISRFYSGSSTEQQIAFFLLGELPNKGWTYRGASSLARAAGFNYVNVLVFSKHNYLAKVYIPKNNPSTYWISLSWGLP